MATFPLSVHASGRYLVDALGVPFLMVGDSPQGLIVGCPSSDAQTYITAQAAKGINCIQVHLIADGSFGGTSGLATKTGLTPFTSAGDIATPRQSYFDYVKTIVQMAADAGMIVMLTAGHTYQSILDLWVNSGNAKCYSFGQYLGTQFGIYTNILWDHGNDFQTWSNATANAAIYNVSDGIRNTAPNHLQTVWLDYYDSNSRDSSAWNSRVDVDFVYTYYTTYADCLNERVLTPAMPYFMGESGYEGEALVVSTTPLLVRKQNWWSILAGAFGTFSCYANVWNCGSSGGQTWLQNLSRSCYTQSTILKDFFSPLHWWLFIPDMSSSHTAMTSGYGTYAHVGAMDSNTYAQTARASDGSCVVAYIPASARTVTIDMTQIAGSTALCRWYNPRTGVYADIGSYATTGTRDFTSPSGSGDTVDNVLLLEQEGSPPIGTPVLSVR